MSESSRVLPVVQRHSRRLALLSPATSAGSIRSRSMWSTRARAMKVEMFPRLYQTPSAVSFASSTSIFEPSVRRNWSARASDANEKTRTTNSATLINVSVRAPGVESRSVSELKRVRIRVSRVLPAELLRAEAVGGTEVVAPRGVNQSRVDFGRAALEEADVGHSVEEVARLAGLHLPVFERVVVEQMIEARL